VISPDLTIHWFYEILLWCLYFIFQDWHHHCFHLL
jgi:hypothetical protein